MLKLCQFLSGNIKHKGQEPIKGTDKNPSVENESGVSDPKRFKPLEKDQTNTFSSNIDEIPVIIIPSMIEKTLPECTSNGNCRENTVPSAAALPQKEVESSTASKEDSNNDASKESGDEISQLFLSHRLVKKSVLDKPVNTQFDKDFKRKTTERPEQVLPDILNQFKSIFDNTKQNDDKSCSYCEILAEDILLFPKEHRSTALKKVIEVAKKFYKDK